MLMQNFLVTTLLSTLIIGWKSMEIHCFFVIWLVSNNIVCENAFFLEQKVAALVILLLDIMIECTGTEGVNKKNELCL